MDRSRISDTGHQSGWPDALRLNGRRCQQVLPVMAQAWIAGQIVIAPNGKTGYLLNCR
jgi:hypothetical protein